MPRTNSLPRPSVLPASASDRLTAFRASDRRRLPLVCTRAQGWALGFHGTTSVAEIDGSCQCWHVHAKSSPASSVVTAIEDAWLAIRQHRTDLPDVMVALGSGRRPRRDLLGHHSPDRWTSAPAGAPLTELFIAGELLAMGAERIMQTILHEAAHALAHIRGIKDCSRSGNRYHNRRFAQLAAEVGLTPPATPSADNGYSDCIITPAAVKLYSRAVRSLGVAAVVYLSDKPDRLDATGRSGRRFGVTCDCGRRLQVSPRAYEEGPILCGRCRSAFRLP